MKVYKGIVNGNTILLEEKPDLPDQCRALVEIKPIDEAQDREITRRHIALLKKAPRVGKLLYGKCCGYSRLRVSWRCGRKET